MVTVDIKQGSFANVFLDPLLGIGDELHPVQFSFFTNLQLASSSKMISGYPKIIKCDNRQQQNMMQALKFPNYTLDDRAALKIVTLFIPTFICDRIVENGLYMFRRFGHLTVFMGMLGMTLILGT